MTCEISLRVLRAVAGLNWCWLHRIADHRDDGELRHSFAAVRPPDGLYRLLVRGRSEIATGSLPNESALVREVREHVLAAQATTGLSAEPQQRLQCATARITDLDSCGMLGLAGAAEIWLDDDASGYGWSFTDVADNDGVGLAEVAVLQCC
jgi:hypothetical protein